MKGVNVLQRVNGRQHAPLVDVLRRRRLDEDAVDRRVAIQAVDQGQKLFGGRFGGRAVELAGDAGLSHAFCLLRT